MAASRPERRLAAVLVADVAGYSRLMGHDDSGTLARLKACRHELLKPLIAEHRGRIVNFSGDSALCEFASVVDAVECAVMIQRRVSERERNMPEPLRFRIGINLGDVVADDGDIYGDGVNIAARLEQLCEPGGLVVSGPAHDQVRGKLDIKLKYLGERRLKNIERPVRVYQAVPGIAEGAIGPVATSPPEKPSIAVLPFANMSRDPDQEYFSDGIAEDLTTDLAKLSGLFVAARHSAAALKGTAVDVQEAGSRLGVRYVLEGSVRQAGEKIRITAQLVDTATGGHLWAERYDRVLTDVFAVQDEITRSIAAALKVKLLPGEDALIGRAPTTSIEAYQLCLRARQLTRRQDRHSYERARRLFVQAVELDPRFAVAHAGIADCDACLYLHHGAHLEVEGILTTANTALALDPNLAAAHVARGLALVAHGQLEEAERAYQRAIALKPDYGSAHFCYARVCVHLGRMEDAARLFHQATELRPNDMHAPGMLTWIEHGLGRTEEAIRAAQVTLERAERELERHPESARAMFFVAGALAVLGNRERAVRLAERALALEPDDHPVHYNVACVYALLGETDRALDLLEHTMPGASAHRWAWLAQDDDFALLRGHPRFRALLERHGHA